MYISIIPQKLYIVENPEGNKTRHSFKLKKKKEKKKQRERPQCIACQMPWTIEHFIVECRDWVLIRNSFQCKLYKRLIWKRQHGWHFVLFERNKSEPKIINVNRINTTQSNY